jgi:hypothetical protein
MDITTACSAIRQCNDSFVMRKKPTVDAKAAALSVATLKQFLERVRADGKPIRELDIEEGLLWTPEGMQSVMPFVISAESMLAYARRKQMN